MVRCILYMIYLSLYCPDLQTVYCCQIVNYSQMINQRISSSDFRTPVAALYSEYQATKTANRA